MMFGIYLLLNLAVLCAVARGSAESGWRLVLKLFLLGWIVGSANSLIEAIFFRVLTLQTALAPAFFATIFSRSCPQLPSSSRAGCAQEPFRTKLAISRR